MKNSTNPSLSINAAQAGSLTANSIQQIFGRGDRKASTKTSNAKKDSAAWNKCAAALATFKREHGHIDVPANYPQCSGLQEWVDAQRAAYQNSVLAEKALNVLEAVGFNWDGWAAKAATKFDRPRAVRQRFGNWFKKQRVAVRRPVALVA